MVANQAFSEHPDAPAGRRRALRQPGAPGARRQPRRLRLHRAVPQLRRERRLLRPRAAAGRRPPGPPTSSTRGSPSASASGSRWSSSRRGRRGGWVDSQVFDHTSVIRFLETWTAALGTPATCPNISAWRRKVCGDLTGAFDFATPGLRRCRRCRPPAPSIGQSPLRRRCPTRRPATNALPAQESGTRPPARCPTSRTATWTTWSSTPAARPCSGSRWPTRARRPPAPRTSRLRQRLPHRRPLAVHRRPAAARATDFFNVGTGYGNGKYDLTMTGPNRFLRRFTGDATAAGKTAEVTTSYAAAPGHRQAGASGSP